MRLNHILNESLLFEQQLKEDPIYKSFRQVGTMIVERQMSQQEIQAVFKAVADGAAAGGNVDKEGDAPASNRTLLGKGADVASRISQAFDAVKTKISQSGPVSGFDVAFDNMQTKLLNAAGGEKGAIGKALAKYREFAQKHPVMQGAIYSGLIALAGISGAGLGGAALLAGLKTFDKLLQGDKASSALWKGFKTGAMAYGASKVGDYIKNRNQMEPANPDDFGATTANQTTTTDSIRIAGQPVVPGQPLSDTQMAVMQQSMAAGNQYPPDIMAQYNAQLSGAGNAVAQGASNAVDSSVSAADSLSPGEEMVSGAGNAAADAATGGVAGQFDGGQYTIMKGDQLGYIAQANGVSVEDIKGLNPQIDFSKPLQPGTTIELPSGSENPGSVWKGYTGAYGDKIPGDTGQAAAAAAQKGATDSVKQGFDKASQPPEEAPLELTPKGGDVSGLEPGVKPYGANMDPEYLKRVVDAQGKSGVRFKINPEDAQKALDWQAQNADSGPQLGGTIPGGNGFSREYLQKVIDQANNPNRPRFMVTPEKAKQLLGQSYVNPKPMLEYIDRDATVRSWALRESVGKPRGGVALTEAGRQAIFQAIVNEGPRWDAFKKGAGEFVKGMGQGFTNPGVRNIKNLSTPQMTGAQIGAAGNKFAKGYGAVAGALQTGADAVGGVLKKGWDSATNKVTYDKLDLNWRKNYKEYDPTGGKGPVDSEVVAKFLRAQGIKDGLISSVFKQLGIPLAGGASTAADATTNATTDTTGGQQGGGTDATTGGQTGGVAGGGDTSTVGGGAGGGSADDFIKQLVAGYNALTPQEKAEIQKEVQSLLATGAVKTASESLQHQFKKLTTESIEAWLESKSGRDSSPLLREAALFEISVRKAKLKKRYK